ncbi:MAG: hypothetical protein JWN69_2281 [Alphaproteobacteria bacterium]|nr:hypothetical protein [Alphaproteobacteria bacterium]
MIQGVKFLIGLAASMLAGWLYLGPLGHGERYIGAVEARAAKVVGDAEIPGVQVRLDRNPLARTATLSGPADEFQRYGQGRLKGLTQLVAEVEGVARVQWADQPPASRKRGLPLLVESLIPIVLAYLLGIALGWAAAVRRRGDFS